MASSTRRQFMAASSALAPAGDLLAAAAPQPKAASAPARRRILAGAWTAEKLAGVLVPAGRWRPFPAAADRAAWEGLPGDVRRALVEAGERGLAGEWPALPATLFLGYARTGNRSNYERVRSVRRERLRELVAAECVEAKGRFLDEIVNGLWVTCEETYWGLPAHLNLQKAGPGLPDVTEPTVDLFAAETGSLLAWADYLVGPQLAKISPLIGPRIRWEIDRRILTPNLDRNDFSWMGLDPRAPATRVNNWNPWINSNWLTCVLIEEPDPKRRAASVYKIMRSLDRFFDAYDDDGGCDEGPGYWDRAGGSLFDCLELLRSATGGALDFYSVPLVREIGRYIYRAHIHDVYYTNFADAAARLNISADLVYRYGARIGDEKMQALGAWAAQRRGDSGVSGSIGRQLAALFNLTALRAAKGWQPLVRDVWLPGVQVMAARLKEGSAKGLYLAAQGGHNAESHNHNDVGNFVVYADGQPAIIDVGVETYTAKTFSSKRYEIWTMQSAYHNLPTVGGVMQKDGRSFAASEVAYRAGDDAAQLSLNIATAYPPEAGMEYWRRMLRLDRVRNQVEVRDVYSLRKAPGAITLSLMTASRPAAGSPGELTLEHEGFRSGKVRILYDPQALAASTEEIRIEDGRLRGAWGDRLYRVLLTAIRPETKGQFTVRIAQ